MYGFAFFCSVYSIYRRILDRSAIYALFGCLFGSEPHIVSLLFIVSILVIGIVSDEYSALAIAVCTVELEFEGLG